MSQALIIFPLIFLAGFIDSVAGGGGLISLPAFLIAGVPMHVAMGTNKLSSSIGSLSASLTFFLHKKIWLKFAFVAAFFAFIGSTLGSFIALHVDASTLEHILIFIIPIMAVIILRKKAEHVFKENETIPWIKISLIGFFVGMYDGFIGPGTGTLLIIGFVSVIHMNYTQASANAKIVNLASGLGALLIFGLDGQVDLILGIWAALFATLGNVLGSHLAIKWGKRLIQPLLVVVLFLLLAKLVMDRI